jgi:hypothetical protein
MLENFVSFFYRQIDIVSTLSSISIEETTKSERKNIDLFKKIAYVSLLDCFAGLRFNRTTHGQLSRHNNKRFTRFLEEYADWKVGKLISLVFLSDRLAKVSSDGKLVKHVNQKLGNLGNSFGDTVCADNIDEAPEALLSLTSTEAEEEAILHCQHYSIIYRYRNNLVHQARRAGGAIESIGEDQAEACYYAYPSDSTMHLLYPTALFRRLCINSFENLWRYMEKNKLDPDKLEDDPKYF